MKVLQVLPALHGGGVERGTLEIAAALVRQGHDSIVASAGGRMVAELEAAGSRHANWNLGRKSIGSLMKVRPFRRWLAEERFDLVHVRSRMPAWITWLAWRQLPGSTRPRLVSTVHGLHSVNRYSEIMTCGERVIVVSETARRYVLDHYPRIPASRLRLIFRGVDPAAWPRGHRPDPGWLRQWHERFPMLTGKRVLALPGRISRLKGHADFLQLLAGLRQDFPEVAGLIVGGEDPRRLAYVAELRARVNALGIADRIVFAGQQSDMRDIYATCAAVFSLSTKPESFGRTVLEPLTLGVPTLGYDRGGVGEILRELYSFGTVPPGDAPALLEKTRVILNGGGPAIACNHRFLLAKMQEETLAVYDELLGSGW